MGTTNIKADIAFARQSQGRKIILSVGGAGNGMSFPNRTKSQTFVDSIVTIYNQLGGFDGLAGQRRRDGARDSCRAARRRHAKPASSSARESASARAVCPASACASIASICIFSWCFHAATSKPCRGRTSRRRPVASSARIAT